jgi:pyridinium-3,5-bisthiocarboxylic acid mononucleotide nickel chelatase
VGTILYFDCFSGVSGDMTLAALLDLGLPRDKLRQEIAKLDLGDYTLNIFPGARHGIAALGFEAQVSPRGETHRHFPDIKKMIAGSSLEARVKEISLAIFQRLAEAEARVHRQKVEEVHFHEVGAVDSIVDIVGAAVGLVHFSPDRILSSELPMGRGFVECRHGRLPVPAPATLEILQGYPVKSAEVEGEMVTPTGAAIVSVLSQGVGPFPAMRINHVGYGMGKSDFPDRPNLLRLVWGETTEVYESDRVVVLEANIDDMNPQFYDFLMERLFARGALDVTLSPLMMKKNRPGTLLRVISGEDRAEELSELILLESTTLGVRHYMGHRKKVSREIREVETRYGRIRVKITGGKNFRPEYEDCKRIAQEKGVPIQEVYQEAMKAKE